MATKAVLYTPAVLALAAELANFPADDALPLHGSARSVSCGSTLALALGLAADGTIAALGVRANACAIGQASAALFARHAVGRTRPDIARAADQIAAWLAGERADVDWPGLETIAAARAYPARHGAVMLAWRAALDALP